MSADQWQLSLRQLYATADTLERAPANVVAVLGAAAPTALVSPILVPSPAVGADDRSTKGILVRIGAHTAATLSLLLVTFAVVDPLLPHPDRPQLSANASPPVGAAPAILLPSPSP